MGIYDSDEDSVEAARLVIALLAAALDEPPTDGVGKVVLLSGALRQTDEAARFLARLPKPLTVTASYSGGVLALRTDSPTLERVRTKQFYLDRSAEESGVLGSAQTGDHAASPTTLLIVRQESLAVAPFLFTQMRRDYFLPQIGYGHRSPTESEISQGFHHVIRIGLTQVLPLDDLDILDPNEAADPLARRD